MAELWTTIGTPNCVICGKYSDCTPVEIPNTTKGGKSTYVCPQRNVKWMQVPPLVCQALGCSDPKITTIDNQPIYNCRKCGWKKMLCNCSSKTQKISIDMTIIQMYSTLRKSQCFDEKDPKKCDRLFGRIMMMLWGTCGVDLANALIDYSPKRDELQVTQLNDNSNAMIVLEKGLDPMVGWNCMECDFDIGEVTRKLRSYRSQ